MTTQKPWWFRSDKPFCSGDGKKDNVSLWFMQTEAVTATRLGVKFGQGEKFNHWNTVSFCLNTAIYLFLVQTPSGNRFTSGIIERMLSMLMSGWKLRQSHTHMPYFLGNSKVLGKCCESAEHFPFLTIFSGSCTGWKVGCTRVRQHEEMGFTQMSAENLI